MDPQRAIDAIGRLVSRGTDLVTFWQGATDVIGRVVPHYESPCWFTLDPASLLATSHFQPGMPEIPAEWLAHEYYADDVHKLADVARSAHGISTLHEVTGGHPERSPGWTNFVRPYGGDQELLLALRGRSGEAWGVMGLYREPDRPRFAPEEKAFLRALAPLLAEGARRGLMLGEVMDPDGDAAPGLVVLDDRWRVESLTPGTDRWLEMLPDGAWSARGVLPPAVLAVAGRALRASEGTEGPGEVGFARVLGRDGRWIVLHGAPLLASTRPRVAVIIEPAHPARVSALLMAVYGLSERERDVTRLVLQGCSTAEIAAQLSISAQTVQQHLKRIFERTGVRSRRELVGRIFFSHYEPRVRDNEHRAGEGRPLRGGPARIPLDPPAPS